MKQAKKSPGDRPPSRLSHFDARGNAAIVDISGKRAGERTAVAEGEIHVGKAVLAAILEGSSAKGDVLGVARLAGIMAAKRTAEMIPLCHPLAMDHCSVDFHVVKSKAVVRARCSVKVTGRTGAEMEALTGAGIALLAIYDMTKALDKGMEIRRLRLLEKSGGKSGHFVNKAKG